MITGKTLHPTHLHTQRRMRLIEEDFEILLSTLFGPHNGFDAAVQSALAEAGPARCPCEDVPSWTPEDDERRVQVVDPTIMQTVERNNQARMAAEQGLAGRMKRLEQAVDEQIAQMKRDNGAQGAQGTHKTDFAAAGELKVIRDAHDKEMAATRKGMLAMNKRMGDMATAFDVYRCKTDGEIALLEKTIKGSKVKGDKICSSGPGTKLFGQQNDPALSAHTPEHHNATPVDLDPVPPTLPKLDSGYHPCDSPASESVLKLPSDKLIKDVGRYVADRIYNDLGKAMTKKQRRKFRDDTETVVKDALQHFGLCLQTAGSGPQDVKDSQDTTSTRAAQSVQIDISSALEAAESPVKAVVLGSLPQPDSGTMTDMGHVMVPAEGAMKQEDLRDLDNSGCVELNISDLGTAELKELYLGKLVRALCSPILDRADRLDTAMLDFERRLLTLLDRAGH